MSLSHPQSVGWVEFIHDTLSHHLVTHNGLSATDIRPALAVHSPSSSISSTQLLCNGQAKNPLESFHSHLHPHLQYRTCLHHPWPRPCCHGSPSLVSCPWVVKIRSSVTIASFSVSWVIEIRLSQSPSPVYETKLTWISQCVEASTGLWCPHPVRQKHHGTADEGVQRLDAGSVAEPLPRISRTRTYYLKNSSSSSKELAQII